MPTEMELLEIVQQIKMRSELINCCYMNIYSHKKMHISLAVFVTEPLVYFLSPDISPPYSGRFNGF